MQVFYYICERDREKQLGIHGGLRQISDRRISTMEISHGGSSFFLLSFFLFLLPISFILSLLPSLSFFLFLFPTLWCHCHERQTTCTWFRELKSTARSSWKIKMEPIPELRHLPLKLMSFAGICFFIAHHLLRSHCGDRTLGMKTITFVKNNSQIKKRCTNDTLCRVYTLSSLSSNFSNRWDFHFRHLIRKSW